MIEQWKLLKNPRIAARFDLIEMISGLLLVLFMWGHMVMLSTILFGEETMNGLSAWLESYYIAQAGALGMVFLILIHFVTAGRKLPLRVNEQRMIWRLTRKLSHVDTWLWLVQVVTGMLILLFVAVHLYFILTTFPIEAVKSSTRVAANFGYLYAPMIIVVELHVGIGLYRILVKWTSFNRSVGALLKWGMTLGFLVVGFWILWTFWTIGMQHVN